MSKPEFTIIVRAEKHSGWQTDTDGIMRLRRLLKRLTRSCGLACIAVKPNTTTTDETKTDK